MVISCDLLCQKKKNKFSRKKVVLGLKWFMSMVLKSPFKVVIVPQKCLTVYCEKW